MTKRISDRYIMDIWGRDKGSEKYDETKGNLEMKQIMK